jgi:hypothetical protein
MLEQLNLERFYRGYGFLNDMPAAPERVERVLARLSRPGVCTTSASARA